MRKLLFNQLSLVYGVITSVRNRLYDLKLIKSVGFDIPVISVGNITVGGTGKTPHTEYLIRLLKSSFRIAVLSRGYKRKSKGFLMVETTSDALLSGDEPLQIKRKFPGVTVAVCENRVDGMRELLKEGPLPDVVLLDDAFQHRKIFAGIHIVLIDYNNPLQKDHMLPYGRLRESPVQLHRANIIIVTKCPEEIKPITRRIMAMDLALFPYQDMFFTTMVYGALYPLFPEAPGPDLFSDTGRKCILLITGIASAEPLIQYVKNMAGEMEVMQFPDHHYYSEDDVLQVIRKFRQMKSSEKIIVTTEKDAVKLISHQGLLKEVRHALFGLPIEVKFLEQGENLFDKKIKAYVGENKSNREIHFRKSQYTS